jgi:hypothetical protein
MLLLGRSLRDAEAAVVEWQVGALACVAVLMSCLNASVLCAQAARLHNPVFTRDA